MKEIWKTIPGYEKFYQASDLGRIKRLISHRCKKERILKSKETKDKYLQITLHKNGLRKNYLVHRLMLETFIGPRPEGMECRHLDGNPSNNKLNNLEWSTHKINMKDIIKHKTFVNNFLGSKHWKSKLTEQNIPEIRKLHLEGKSDGEIAKIYKVSKVTINNIINKKIWKHIK